MLMTQLAQEVDFLTEELEAQKEKTINAKIEMLSMVPKRHYDAAIGSMKVCQGTIETLMVELRKFEPANQIAHDASIILGGLEAIITPDRMQGKHNFQDKSGSGIFGTVEKTYDK